MDSQESEDEEEDEEELEEGEVEEEEEDGERGQLYDALSGSKLCGKKHLLTAAYVSKPKNIEFRSQQDVFFFEFPSILNLQIRIEYLIMNRLHLKKFQLFRFGRIGVNNSNANASARILTVVTFIYLFLDNIWPL